MGITVSLLDQCLSPSIEVEDVIVTAETDSVMFSVDEIDAVSDTKPKTLNAFKKDDDNNSESIETVQDLDSHAKQVPKSFLKSFKNLLGYFERSLEDKKDKHQLLIRSFLIWLGGLDIPDAEALPLQDLKENDSRTPDEYLKLLKKNLNIYNSIFILLCWSAGIKCFKIKGVYKTDGLDNVASSRWAAVNVNGAWQIVHPYRICRALSGKFPQGWFKSKTEDLNTSDVEIFKTSFLDYYINPKPEQFIYEFFPDDTDWQLLPDPITENNSQNKSYITIRGGKQAYD
ncbi:Hypothetical predicted protein [Mytilus galloprovincialis]|uniref:Transglutaminase-like domain-containing protein n=1 Tax=Mytilus galloprovincialis TaxID=29158 RepID=A0A8B6G231_MYTGA|nr:Hypothetical predicted protein [Mytilus galloprovincialis]